MKSVVTTNGEKSAESKFFDNVNQDILMILVHKVIKDPDTELLIRRFLQSGVLVEGTFEETRIGTPQEGNLSPLLANIYLNEFDKELESRGLRFTRYADDCVIYVKSEAAANRVMKSVTRWLEEKLRLQVNVTKTKVCRPNDTKYLGFSFYKIKPENGQKCIQYECNSAFYNGQQIMKSAREERFQPDSFHIASALSFTVGPSRSRCSLLRA